MKSLRRLARVWVVAGFCLAASATGALADQDDIAQALSAARGSGSPTVDWYRILPTVVRSDRTAPVTVTIKITGGVPDKVALVLAANNSEIVMHDDGLNGDAVAGDAVYSVLVSAATVTGGLQAADVFRRFLGFGDVYLGATRVVRANVFAQIWTPTIGTVSVVSPDAQTQYSSYVVNVVDAAAFATSFAVPGSVDFRPVAHRLYQRFPDIFDFIDVVVDRANIANRYHFATRNSTLGIGVPVFDTNAGYGSAGRLQGISVFPSNVIFDTADSGHAHELGHQWINFLGLPLLAAGSPHWPVSTLASGTMGHSIQGSNVGGQYPCALTATPGGVQVASLTSPRVFTDLDLYLMGMLPPAQVTTHYVFKDQAGALNLPCSGTLPYSMFTPVTINDVVGSAGSRNPAWPNAKRDFTVAVVVVSDTLLSPEAMAFYDWFARRAEARTTLTTHLGLVSTEDDPFYLQTAGRGTLTSRLSGLGVWASVNQATFSNGQTLAVGGSVVNPGAGGLADFYAGLLRPDGSILFFLGTGGTALGNVANLASYRSAAVAVPLGTPFSANVPTLYTHPWTAADQRGGYVFFIAAVKTGALASGGVTNDEILGLAAAPFSLP